MNHNRIGDHCWYCRFDYKTKKVEDWQIGFLRSWGMDFEEYESGPAMFPVGVIEDEKTGVCHSVSVNRICFASQPPASL